jgi:PAS domain S-box-containing protein
MTGSLSTWHDQILDSIADGVFTVDRDWNITSFNNAAERITGVSRKSALGSKCWEVFHADVCERDCLLKKTIKTKKQCVNKTVYIVNKAGKTVPISISTAILTDAKSTIVGGVETFRDLSEIEVLRKEISGKYTHYDMISKNHQLLKLLDILPTIAQSSSPVLVLGESGTGKELLAKALHNLSNRAEGPFVAVNCGALQENLLESELFGYKKGAFTDAKSDKPGRFDRAKGGTLFLDEIGDLQKSLQVKLLRVLQEQVYEPLGSTEPVKSDVRIIAATNRNLIQMVDSGDFRQDLFYRIHVMPVTLPPLRDRLDDIPLLVDHFISNYNAISRKKFDSVSPDVMSVLLTHRYPGNIRELENILQHAFVLCQGKIIEKNHLPQYLLQIKIPDVQCIVPDKNSWESFEKSRIQTALEKNQYHREKTAKELGIHVATLWRKINKYGINNG